MIILLYYILLLFTVLNELTRSVVLSYFPPQTGISGPNPISVCIKNIIEITFGPPL